jgi:hypothetical protein
MFIFQFHSLKTSDMYFKNFIQFIKQYRDVIRFLLIYILCNGTISCLPDLGADEFCVHELTEDVIPSNNRNFHNLDIPKIFFVWDHSQFSQKCLLEISPEDSKEFSFKQELHKRINEDQNINEINDFLVSLIDNSPTVTLHRWQNIDTKPQNFQMINSCQNSNEDYLVLWLSSAVPINMENIESDRLKRKLMEMRIFQIGVYANNRVSFPENDSRFKSLNERLYGNLNQNLVNQETGMFIYVVLLSNQHTLLSEWTSMIFHQNICANRN